MTTLARHDPVLIHLPVDGLLRIPGRLIIAPTIILVGGSVMPLFPKRKTHKILRHAPSALLRMTRVLGLLEGTERTERG